MQFMLEHYQDCRDWNPVTFRSWVNWFQGQGYIGEILNYDHSLAGLVVARPVMEADDAYDHYAFDPEGSCIFVDVLIALTPQAKKAAAYLIIKRFGVRSKVAWKREVNGEIKEYSAESARRNIFRRETIHHGTI